MWPIQVWFPAPIYPETARSNFWGMQSQEHCQMWHPNKNKVKQLTFGWKRETGVNMLALHVTDPVSVKGSLNISRSVSWSWSSIWALLGKIPLPSFKSFSVWGALYHEQSKSNFTHTETETQRDREVERQKERVYEWLIALFCKWENEHSDVEFFTLINGKAEVGPGYTFTSLCLYSVWYICSIQEVIQNSTDVTAVENHVSWKQSFLFVLGPKAVLETIWYIIILGYSLKLELQSNFLSQF